jgi:hypothetical protein
MDADASFADLDLDVGPSLRTLRMDATSRRIVEWAHELTAERERGGIAESSNPLWSKVLHGDAILTLPPPRPLVGGLLQLDSLAAIYGPPASGKSLLALDIALSIAARRAWQGRDVVDGPVLYVVAEDAAGMGARSRAWRARHGELGDIHWLPQRVPLLEASAVTQLCDVVARVAPALIVLDTLAKCMVGADENSTREMGLTVDALTRLQAVINSCVCVVHHGGKDASRGMRGSSALLAAADTAIECKPTRDGMTATVEKQKNGPDGHRMHFRFDAEGDSVVLVEGLPAAPSAAAFRPTVLMERVSRHLESAPDANLRAVRTAIGSKAEYVDLALARLVEEGFVTTAPGPRNATLHRSVKPYRDDSDDGG